MIEQKRDTTIIYIWKTKTEIEMTKNQWSKTESNGHKHNGQYLCL